MDLRDRLRERTLTDIAVSMWNHAPQMSGQAKTFAPGEMQQLLSYIWAEQYFEDRGNRAGGPARSSPASRAPACHSGSGKRPRPFRRNGPVLVSLDGRFFMASWPRDARNDEADEHSVATIDRAANVRPDRVFEFSAVAHSGQMLRGSQILKR